MKTTCTCAFQKYHIWMTSRQDSGTQAEIVTSWRQVIPMPWNAEVLIPVPASQVGFSEEEAKLIPTVVDTQPDLRY